MNEEKYQLRIDVQIMRGYSSERISVNEVIELDALNFLDMAQILGQQFHTLMEEIKLRRAAQKGHDDA